MKQRRIYLPSLVFLATFACSVEMFGQVNPSAATGRVRYWITATKKGHPVTDLQKEDLQLWIGKEKQSISALDFNLPEPLKLGLLIDTSGSERGQWLVAATSLAPSFLRRAIRPGDQAFIIHFNNLFFVDVSPTADVNALEQGLERLARTRPAGGTALRDAIMAASSQGNASEPAHRVLVVITDGEDNASRYTLDQAMTAVGKTGTQLYVIRPGLDPSRGAEMLRAIRVLRALSGAGGG
jgi:VWFA-related protein